MKEVEITLSDDVLGQILNIPHGGILTKTLVDHRVGLRCVLNIMNVKGIGDLMSNTLSTNLKVLHHIIRRIFIPKTRIFDFVSERELP